MLFEDKDSTVYNEGLIVDDVENYKQALQESKPQTQAERNAMLGITRTPNGIRAGSTMPAMSEGVEMYSGGDSLIEDPNEWITISAGDLSALRLLGVTV